MPAIWVWPIIILPLVVISALYLVRRPASHRLPVSICIVEVLLFGILTSIIEPLPLNILYVLILASTPLLAIGILVISALGKRIRVAIQTQDETQEKALTIRFLLSSPLILLPGIFIFLLIQRSPNIQHMLILVQPMFVVVALLVAGFRGAMTSLRQPAGWRSFQFILSAIAIAGSILFAYLLAHSVFLVL
jgi:uncharacterized membrane protein SirB2